MWLSNKIEEVRRKPERVRMRYVWSCVTVSMVFVLFVWMISLESSSIAEKSDSLKMPDLKLDQFNSITSSFSDVLENEDENESIESELKENEESQVKGVDTENLKNSIKDIKVENNTYTENNTFTSEQALFPIEEEKEAGE